MTTPEPTPLRRPRMMLCSHPLSLRRVHRVVMPEAVYRTPYCGKCRYEFPEQTYSRTVQARKVADDHT